MVVWLLTFKPLESTRLQIRKEWPQRVQVQTPLSRKTPLPYKPSSSHIIEYPYHFTMASPKQDFMVLDDTRPNDGSLPAFMVSTTRGFLPRMDPIVDLPLEFAAAESLLTRMPVKTISGEPGLLADGVFGDAVLDELPDLTHEVEKYKDNLPLVNALYRDYSFLASAYLLEPCHMRFLKGEGYGLARDVLPMQLARPIVRCAEL